jgi:hypothetical protein
MVHQVTTGPSRVNNSGHIATNAGMLVNNEQEEMWKEVATP